LLNKNKIYINIFAVLLFFSSCGFVDLRSIDVRTNPKNRDTVVPGEYSPVSVWFGTEMVRNEAENLLLVSSDTGMVEGDRFWNGNTLLFVPAAGWTAGTRYVLGVSGMARAVDGREIRLDIIVPFFALNRSPPPLVEYFSPADGESVSVSGLQFRICFSQPMDKPSVETALTVEGMSGKIFEWQDDKTLTLIPERNLSPWTIFRWTIKTSAKSAAGVPLPNVVSAVFSTDYDRLLPQVSGVYPVIHSDGYWFQTGGSLEEDFGPGLGIVVEFNKPMADTVIRSLRFEPSLTGRTEIFSDKSIIFVPSRDPEPETVYTLIVSGETKDTEGLKTGIDYRRVFTADIPYLHIISVNVMNDGGIEQHLLQDSGWETRIIPVQVSEADGDLIRFTVYFSQLFDIEAKQKAALAVSLVPFFPASTEPTALRYAMWLSDDRLSLGWERLKPGKPGEPHYYKLLFHGGRNGIENGGGMYLKQDISLIMEAVK